MTGETRSTEATNLAEKKLSSEERKAKRVGGALDNLAHTIERTDLESRELEDLLRVHWPKAIALLVLAVLALWVWESLEGSRAKVTGETAERFSSAQEIFQKEILPGVAIEGEKSSGVDKRRAFEDSLRSLTSGYSASTYSRVGEIYLAAADVVDGKTADAKRKLERFDVAVLLNSDPKKPRVATAFDERVLIRELAALVYVRALIVENSPSVRDNLRRLVANADFVNGEAALALLQISKTRPEIDEAVGVAKKLVLDRPELVKVVGKELERFGIESE
ncbi:MAG: hypothetical protein IT290_04310 [Deltaproteobacteria bacterium]|nr:hypothetical protein [Deltaproteobacteria bacterium]